MNTPEYIFAPEHPWNAWSTTTVAPLDAGFIIGADSAKTTISKQDLDSAYPGFSAAYNTLADLGCSASFITSILKFSIIHENGLGVDKFIDYSNTIVGVKLGLSIGLNGQETVAAMTNPDGSLRVVMRAPQNPSPAP